MQHATHASMAPRAPKPRRRWPRYLAILLLVMMFPFVVVATTIAATGTVTVRVADHNEGMNLVIPVPALLFDLAAFVAPRVIPEEALADIRREVGPYRAVLLEAARALEDCPSGVLVEVDNRDEHVIISKHRSRFLIRVDSPDVDVRVTVPDRLMRRALQALDLG